MNIQPVTESVRTESVQKTPFVTTVPTTYREGSDGDFNWQDVQVYSGELALNDKAAVDNEGVGVVTTHYHTGEPQNHFYIKNDGKVAVFREAKNHDLIPAKENPVMWKLDTYENPILPTNKSIVRTPKVAVLHVGYPKPQQKT